MDSVSVALESMRKVKDDATNDHFRERAERLRMCLDR